MLKSLEIQNFALIDKLVIEFSPKLNVLSGETGAGKSIIIDALNFVIGGKTSKSLIKQGKDNMKVSALFSLENSNTICEILKDYDIDFEDEILITRKLNAEGKAEVKVNGYSVTVNMLKSLTSLLIDIHGQHEHQRLLKDKFHLEIIDGFLKDKSIFISYQNALNMFKTNEAEIKKLIGNGGNQERLLELLNYQIDEIERAKLKNNEDEELTQKKLVMMNFEKINESLTNSVFALDGQSSIIDNLKKASSCLQSIIKYDETCEGVVTRLDSLRYELIDIIETLKDKKENCDFDEKEFERIDERLDHIKALKKKYGATVNDILLFLDNSKKEYDDIVNSKDKLEKLYQQKKIFLQNILDSGKVISLARKKVAAEFEKNVATQLCDLGMKNAKFKVCFNDFPTIEEVENKFQLSGLDEVRFLFSANAGQSLMPLSEIISGGEASRFMLALKNILAENDNIGAMVFDEIDTGISGDMGYKVACKLANISQTHQVMSVSHLPQICAMADNNIKIVKSVVDENTKVQAIELDYPSILQEISRLSGGLCDSKISLEHAKELKNRCIEYKNSI